jgi:hypothetical protein
LIIGAVQAPGDAELLPPRREEDDMKLSRVIVVTLSLTLVLSTGVAAAKTVSIGASPNPARVGDRVRHEVVVGTVGRLDVWVSASGFERPGSGTLPNGTWSFECCPSQTAGTPAWHYRSSSFVSAARYRFPAIAGTRGTFLSSAGVAGVVDGVWISIR